VDAHCLAEPEARAPRALASAVSHFCHRCLTYMAFPLGDHRLQCITVRRDINHNLGLTWADDTAGWCGTPRDTFEHLFETESGEREVTATKLTD